MCLVSKGAALDLNGTDAHQDCLISLHTKTCAIKII